jgi:very-short-patch-repair endonuclease
VYLCLSSCLWITKLPAPEVRKVAAMRGQNTPPLPARRQAGMFSQPDAAAHGYSNYRVRRLLATRQWIVVLGSVLAVAGTPLTPVAIAWAAVLAAGAGGVASHLTAARMWGLLVPPDPEVHAIVPRDSRVRLRGLRTHRVPLPDIDVTEHEGVLTTSLIRTIVDCLLWLPADAGRQLLVDAQRRGLVQPEQVRAYLIESPCRHGMGRAWSVLADASGAFSEAEVTAHRLLRRARITGWRKNISLYDADGLMGVADVVFELQRVIMEIDGRRYHSDDVAFQHDRTRQNRLVANGYTVLRFTWKDLTERPDYVLECVRSALARAAA